VNKEGLTVMKQHFLQTPARVIAGMVLVLGSTLTGVADDSATAAAPPPAAVPAAPTSPVQLSHGATEVAQLAKAKVADDTIIAFVQNSGRAYNVTAPEILALRSEGVSDRVITAMLEQQTKKQTVAAAQPAPAVAPPPADAASQPAPPPAAPAAAYAPAPAVTYVQTAPAYAPPSTVYVPYAAPPYYYDPYYGSYGYGYAYPPVSLSFGFGFGGGHGGYYHGGGFHGGHR
jgi:hypothetical protein